MLSVFLLPDFGQISNWPTNLLNSSNIVIFILKIIFSRNGAAARGHAKGNIPAHISKFSLHACQKRKGERAFVIPSGFEPSVFMMELYMNVVVT
jgi:hypothetical protein